MTYWVILNTFRGRGEVIFVRKKYKRQKIILGVIGFVLAAIIAGSLFGGESRTNVLMVKEPIDINKPLELQENKFVVRQILKSEADSIAGGLARDFNDIKGKKSLVPLKMGDVVPFNVLKEGVEGGQFAKEMAEYHTTFTIEGGQFMLPPGVMSGDLIDVALFVESPSGENKDLEGLTKEEYDALEEWEKENPELMIGVVSSNVEVHSVDRGNLNLKVSQTEALKLKMHAKIGEFVLQLPGQKEVGLCVDVKEQYKEDLMSRYKLTQSLGGTKRIVLDVESVEEFKQVEKKLDEIGSMQKIDELLDEEFGQDGDKSIKEAKRKTLMVDYMMRHIEKEVEKVDCYEEEDKAEKNITKEEVLKEMLKKGFYRLSSDGEEGLEMGEFIDGSKESLEELIEFDNKNGEVNDGQSFQETLEDLGSGEKDSIEREEG